MSGAPGTGGRSSSRTRSSRNDRQPTWKCTLGRASATGAPGFWPTRPTSPSISQTNARGPSATSLRCESEGVSGTRGSRRRSAELLSRGERSEGGRRGQRRAAARSGAVPTHRHTRMTHRDSAEPPPPLFPHSTTRIRSSVLEEASAAGEVKCSQFVRI